ncbi:MAG TPA: hypothetical protein PKV93_06020 [Fervidobacterium sp.]|nr:hypothetical protein [Fervidobacterium sp.]
MDRKFLDGIGILAYHTGVRPSSLLEWVEQDEWEARLCFDMCVMGPIIEKMSRSGKI